MAYPPPPWELKGEAVQSFRFIDAAAVRPLAPKELSIVQVWPGKTLGGVYFASYGKGSTLEYKELIVVAALARYKGKTGFWIHRIYVDNPDSVAGGKEIWGLPKEMADFEWKENCITVRQGEKTICSLEFRRGIACPFRLMVPVPSFGILGPDIVSFTGRLGGFMGFIHSQLEVPSSSPIAPLGFGKKGLTIRHDKLLFCVGAPIPLTGKVKSMNLHK